MRGFIVPILLFIIVFLAVVVFGALKTSETSNLDDDHEVASSSPLPSSASPLPLKPIRDTAVVAAPDGTIYFVDINSGKVLWSFASGSSIYSSYQALPNYEDETDIISAESDNFYIDIGEDWELYMHGNGFKKVKLPLSIEEFLRRTPFTSPGGGILLGSKKSTVFVIDAKTGKIIRTLRSGNFTSDENQDIDENPILPRMDIEDWSQSSATELDGVDEKLHVTRKDYALKYTSTKTGKVLWYLTFADIEASFPCEEVESSLGEILYGGKEHDPRQNFDMDLRLRCPTRPVVYRIRDRSSLESLFIAASSPSALPGDQVLSLPVADLSPKLEPLNKLQGLHRQNESDLFLALPAPETKDFGIPALPGGDIGQINNSAAPGTISVSHFWPFALSGSLMLLMVVFHSYLRHLLSKKSGKVEKQADELRIQAEVSKKKKTRKSGISKKTSTPDKNRKDVSHDQLIRVASILPDVEKSKHNLQPTLFNSSNDLAEGRKIGRLFVFTKEIARGSNGTVVLEGIYDGRPVAVKRLVQTHHDVALKEILNLIASDHHPNIVRWYGVEYDQDFVYLALERCACSLHDLILSYSASSQDLQINSQGKDTNSCCDQSFRLQLAPGNNSELELWKSNGYPSSHLLKLMRDIVHGLAHLHELGIVHRDLKPQNILVVKKRSLHAKLSDMGISKRLAGNMTSLTKHATGYGSSGWQAPEQLRQERQTRAVDLFSLGCLLFFCITGGQHPFGESFERDVNIVNNQKDLFLIENLPEATDLITNLLDPNPELRPKVTQITCHPLFWNSQMRLEFLRDASDRVELEDRGNESELLGALESIGGLAFGGKWNEKLDSAFVNDIGHYRRYKFDGVRDLLRVIRNKFNHYRQLSKEIQDILGPLHEGFDSYFSTRFPKLLIEVYKVIQLYCAEEEMFYKYFRSNQF